jgi:UDP-3-O-[3-hydroxymyristoyl] glucosamine N-acyltransferase
VTTPALTARAIADLVGGRLDGPEDIVLRRVRSLERAEGDALALCSGPRWTDALAASRAGAVLLPPTLHDAPGPTTRIVVNDPVRAMAAAASALHPPPATSAGVHVTATIGPRVTLSPGVEIGPHVVVKADAVLGEGVVLGPGVVVEAGVVIGAGSRLDAHVVVHEGSVLGARVWCKAGAVIGGQGFGFVSGPEGHVRVPQVGGCLLGDDVEVGSGSCIDRGSLDDTVIGRGTKIDNLVHVGHNVRIGEHCLLVAGVGVSGSTQVGHRVLLGGQAGLAGHLQIGDDARVGAQAGVISSIPPGAAVSGYPARPHREFLRAQAALYRLAEHVSALEALAKERTQDA